MDKAFRENKDLLLVTTKIGELFTDRGYSLSDAKAMLDKIKNDSWQRSVNSYAETFFKSLKSEWLYDINFKTRQDVKNVLFKYIEIFYNHQRSHSFLVYNTPEGYESNSVAYLAVAILG